MASEHRPSARGCALAVLRRTFEQGAFTDRAFHAEAAGLDARDRALAMRLAYGAVQRRLTLDTVAERLTERPTDALDARVLAALRLGLYELLFSAAAQHAVVTEAVELAKPGGRGGAGLVNAVLRRAAREREELLASVSADGDPLSASVAHSMPLWIVELWWEALGGEQARRLLARINEPAEHALRANTLLGDAAALAAALPVPASLPGDPPEAVVIEQAFDAHASPLWREGRFMPQSRASMLVAHALAPQPGERVLDLCAAPGAKTTHIAALMEARGELVAVERNEARAEALQRNCRRMHAGNVRVSVGDAAGGAQGERYDRVLLDPPCSGLGTMHSRPDLRWRARSDEQLVQLQGRLLSAAAAAVVTGGTLVYSTCTLAPAENERRIEAFLDEQPEFEMIDLAARFPRWRHPAGGPELLALPHVQGSDGFFIAALRRRSGR